MQLSLSSWVAERQLEDGAWVVFAPHRSGLPVLVDTVGHALLDAFAAGPIEMEAAVRRVSEAIPPGMAGTVDAELRVLTAAFFSRGFLVTGPEPGRHAATAPEMASRSLAVWLELTDSCNLSCGYCFVRKGGLAMTDEILQRATGAIVSTAVTRGVKEVEVRLAGGEPTLVLPAMERAHDLLVKGLGAAGIALRVTVVTNGTCANERLLAFLRRPGVTLAVSVDGVGAAHDLHRIFAGTGRGSWEIVASNIDRLRADGVRLTLGATIGEETCTSFPELVEWAVARQLPIVLGPVDTPESPWRGERPDRGDYGRYSERLIESVEGGFRVLERHLEAGTAVPDLVISQLGFDHPFSAWCCGIGSGYVTVTAGGDVASCPRTARERVAPLGDDLITVAASLFPYSPAERNGREADECLACRWFPVCAGGCPLMNLLVDDDPCSRSPLCEFRRYVIPRYVEYLGKRLLHEVRRSGGRMPHMFQKLGG